MRTFGGLQRIVPRWVGVDVVIVISVIMAMTAVSPEQVAGEFTVGACFNQSEKTLTMTCPVGHMVKVTRVLQGHSSARECVWRDGDCIHEIKDGSFPCVGRQICEVNLPSGDVGAVLHVCETHATYMHVQYDCVPDTIVMDICSMDRLTAQSGYISSPRYPNNYPSALTCRLTVETAHPAQKLRLYALDLLLDGDSRAGCRDSLYMFDRHRSYTTCSSVARKQLMLTMENYLELEFVSDGEDNQKGFWLYYEAEPFMTTTTVPPTPPGDISPSTTVAKPSNISVVIIDTIPKQPSPVDTETDTHGQQKLGFPIGLLVGIILGALLCAVIILFVIIILRRRRMKLTQSASCASNVAIMASQISKPIPPQTLHNTLQSDKDFSLDKPPHNEGSLRPDHTEIDLEFEKAISRKEAFIDRNVHTGEEQLFC